MADLRMIYIASDPGYNAPELRCTDHPEWEADVDAEDLPTVIRRAMDHFRDEHRVHVTGCMCRSTQVIDQRCVPQLTITGPQGQGGERDA